MNFSFFETGKSIDMEISKFNDCIHGRYYNK